MKIRLLFSLGLTFLILVFAAVGSASAATVYVNINSTHPYPDGQSWETAFTSVKSGLDAAVAGDEVWVAKGKYIERISLKKSVALYGGFAGFESSRDQRDFKTNVTILDGDKSGSVVSSSDGAASDTRLDGFTIQNGTGVYNTTWFFEYGNHGGGILLLYSAPTIVNNVITGNRVSGNGGGIYCYGSNPNISGNIITGNTAGDIGGGIYCNKSPIIRDNIIKNNYCGSPNNTYGYGGGIGCRFGSPSILNNSIIENRAYRVAGGIFVSDNSSSIIANNIFIKNTAGGMISWSSNPSITNNTFSENDTAIHCYNSSPNISNNIIAFGSLGITNDGDGVPVLKNNDVYGNTNGNYINLPPGQSDISADPLFVDRTSGDYHIQPTSPCIDAGDNGSVQLGWVDMDGEARILGAHVDIGADEVNLDTTAPTTTIILDGILGQNGWYTSDVTVTLSATDGDGTGVAKTEYSFDGVNWSTYIAPFTVSNEGLTTVYYRSIDNIGNAETAKTQEVKIDKTSPLVSITMPESGAAYLLNQLVLASWSVEDYVSGIFSTDATTSNGQAIDTAIPGENAFAVTATDYAGLQASTTHTYYVRYNYFGVLEPINQDGSSIFRTGKNRVIPVKFQLKDANGNYVSTAIARLYYAKVTDNVTGTVMEANTTGQANTDNLFRYDSENNQYIYNLDTNALSAGTWELQIVLDDGTTKTVRISIK